MFPPPHTSKKHFCVKVVSSSIYTVPWLHRAPLGTLPASYFLFLFQIISVHQNRCTWTMPTLSLPCFPTLVLVLPVLSRLSKKSFCMFCASHQNSTTSLRVEIWFFYFQFQERGHAFACDSLQLLHTHKIPQLPFVWKYDLTHSGECGEGKVESGKWKV